MTVDTARLAGAAWRTSTRSQSTNCVEVAPVAPGGVAMRDSKDRSGPVLVFSLAQWRDFVAGTKGGEFDLER